MTALEFLSQAYRIDLRIHSKLAQIESLNELAEKCTLRLTGMPRSMNNGTSQMADAVAKIVDLQEEINSDVVDLVETKRGIVNAIKSVKNEEYQTLLELRFLCGCTWEEIAAKMGYSVQHTFRLRNQAISKVESQ